MKLSKNKSLCKCTTAGLKCILLSNTVNSHIQQLYTGFKLLSDKGIISVIQRITPSPPRNLNSPQYLQNASKAHLKVILNTPERSGLNLHFDNHDAMEIDKDDLNACHVYFKRSFSKSYIASHHQAHQHKILPLGLNYLVYPDHPDYLAIQRYASIEKRLSRKISGVVSELDWRNHFIFRPRIRDIISKPRPADPPKVLFMTKAYDPYDIPNRPPEKIKERDANNEFRAACIRQLRKELGDLFYGGFTHTPYAMKQYPDQLIEARPQGNKKNYLKRVKAFPIGITTIGLHGSNGWKLAEYVALSNAIITEKLLYEVPGQFRENRNYLEFSSVDTCVAQAKKLIKDNVLRAKMMAENHAYYHRYLRPDVLILNALKAALDVTRSS